MRNFIAAQGTATAPTTAASAHPQVLTDLPTAESGLEPGSEVGDTGDPEVPGTPEFLVLVVPGSLEGSVTGLEGMT